MAPRGGAIWPSAGAETYGGVHPWRDLTGTRSPHYGSGGGCEGGVGSSGIGNRESGIGNRESSGKHSSPLSCAVCFQPRALARCAASSAQPPHLAHAGQRIQLAEQAGQLVVIADLQAQP
ncbi:hypothetical protein EIJ57_07155 [Xanthomonas perforans]|nr:hypothetical protein DB761_01065 [Xanthomonas perforans]RXD65381.1 hypothetical protein DB759_00780 [Xanthomonas perforans]RXD69621.1 hypothetical protein DB763_19855 [Xanthomonas perforans]RXD69990.1 hypothetical protein DB766_07195 [Xanthomonas perforans]RXE00763.1 hypothetical protein DB795_08935 [Xanthomonas perforans]